MTARIPSSKETITLSWEMPYDAWDHWAQGRGEKSVRDVILEAIDQIRKCPEAVKERCKSGPPEPSPEGDDGQPRKHRVKIELPTDDWGEAVQLVGRIDNRPVGTRRLLAALILESESWQQGGDHDAEFDAGWLTETLESSTDSLTATTAGVSLAREEKRLARRVAWAAVVGAVAALIGAVAAVASAVDAWCNP